MQVRLMTAVIAAAMSLGAAVSVAKAKDPAFGVWWTEEKDSRIEIAPCGDGGKSACGNIVWLAEPNDDNGKPKHDINNEDEVLKARPIIGLPLIQGFSNDGPGKWEDGSIYDPRDGKNYSSNMEIQDDGTLEVEGCVLFLCKGTTWTRYQ